MEPVTLRGAVHATNDLGEEFAIQIGKEDTERFGLARNETARATVWHVAHSAGDFTNEPPRLFTYWSAAVEDSGYGGDGHVCFTGDILDRDHSPSGVSGRSSVERNKYVIVYIEGARYMFREALFGAAPFPRGIAALNFREWNIRELSALLRSPPCGSSFAAPFWASSPR